MSTVVERMKVRKYGFDADGSRWLLVNSKYAARVVSKNEVKVQHLGAIEFEPNPVIGAAVDRIVLKPLTVEQQLLTNEIEKSCLLFLATEDGGL